jgi:hypothetical protein
MLINIMIVNKLKYTSLSVVYVDMSSMMDVIMNELTLPVKSALWSLAVGHACATLFIILQIRIKRDLNTPA